MRQDINAKLNHLTEDERKAMKPSLQKFAHVFFEEGVGEFCSTKLVTYRTETGGAASIRKAPLAYLSHWNRQLRFKCRAY
jgi:hypothetical protein